MPEGLPAKNHPRPLGDPSFRFAKEEVLANNLEFNDYVFGYFFILLAISKELKTDINLYSQYETTF